MTKKKTLQHLRHDEDARRLIENAQRRERREAASGDTLDFALLVVDEVRRAERDRVLPAVRQAIACFDGWTDNAYAVEARAALRRAFGVR